jgi:hypothetical protein
VLKFLLMQGEILASPTRAKEMILIKQPIGVAALITPVSITLNILLSYGKDCCCVAQSTYGHTVTQIMSPDKGVIHYMS